MARLVPVTSPLRKREGRCYGSGMKTLATEAEVDTKGWLDIHALAPPGTPPGKLEVVVVLASSVPEISSPARPRAGTLPGKVELASDYHAPV